MRPAIGRDFRQDYRRAELWAPLGYDRSEPFACRNCQHLKALARLKPDASLATAQADIDVVHARLRREHPTDYADASPWGPAAGVSCGSS